MDSRGPSSDFPVDQQIEEQEGEQIQLFGQNYEAGAAADMEIAKQATCGNNYDGQQEQQYLDDSMYEKISDPKGVVHSQNFGRDHSMVQDAQEQFANDIQHIDNTFLNNLKPSHSNVSDTQSQACSQF